MIMGVITPIMFVVGIDPAKNVKAGTNRVPSTLVDCGIKSS